MSQSMRPQTLEAMIEIIALLQYSTGYEVRYTFRRMETGDEIFLVVGSGDDINQLRHQFTFSRLGVERAYPVRAVTNMLFFPESCPNAMVQTAFGNFGYTMLPDPVVMKLVSQFSTLNPQYMRHHYLLLHKSMWK